MASIGQHLPVEPERSDGDVIAASVEDPAQFTVVFSRHFGQVHRYLARRVGVALADDLAADTFLIAFRSRHRFRSGALDARPWLFGIAANLLRRHRRAEARQLRAYARTGLDPLDDEITAAERRVDAGAAGPRLAGALASLKRVDREVLLLVAWADLSYEEVAAALSIPIGTVRSRLSRARGRMREALMPAFREPDVHKGRIEIESATEGGRNG
jgi:RNA polymerase sigma-70 factor (ECF subfamily)